MASGVRGREGAHVGPQRKKKNSAPCYALRAKGHKGGGGGGFGGGGQAAQDVARGAVYCFQLLRGEERKEGRSIKLNQEKKIHPLDDTEKGRKRGERKKRQPLSSQLRQTSGEGNRRRAHLLLGIGARERKKDQAEGRSSVPREARIAEKKRREM